MQVIIQFLLDKIVDKLGYCRSFRSHIFRTQLRLGLTFKDRFFYFYTDGGNNTGTNIRIIEVLVVIFLDNTSDCFLKSRQMCTTLRCMLTVYERIIFFSVLVTVRNHYFNILTFQMDDGIKRFGCHIFIQQINQTIPRMITFPVIKNRQSAVQKDIILQ